jgi:beta-mannanase
MKAILELGSIPMITWEPWLIDFDKTKHDQLRDVEVRDKGGLKDIASGVYDFYLETWVNDLKLFGKPLFIRWGHEMNDPYRYSWGPQNNAPEDFIAAWKHVVDYFRANGVNDVIWVWSPHIAYGLFDEYYPGDDYVDWVGVGTLNYGTVAIWSQWWTFDEIFGNHYAAIDKFKKPIMATEFGSLAVGGDRALWYQDALCKMPEKYPSLKSVLFFHFGNDNTLTNKSLDWYISSDTLITNSIVKCFNSWPGSVLVK